MSQLQKRPGVEQRGCFCFENLINTYRKGCVFFLTSVLFQNNSCMYCTKLGTNVVQGENVDLWRENQVMSLLLLLFLVPFVILAVSSQSVLSVLQGGQLCFPFTDDVCFIASSSVYGKYPQRVFLACLAVDCHGICSRSNPVCFMQA